MYKQLDPMNFPLRCLKVISEEVAASGEEEEEERRLRRLCLVTASNDGFVKAWKVERRGGGKFDVALAASHDTKCRITCMAVHKVIPATQGTHPQYRSGTVVC